MGILNYISVAGIIGYVATSFNKEHDKFTKNKEKYFDNFLVKFYAYYRMNPDINIEKFYYENFNYDDIYIPPYITYLLENKLYDKLKKVIIADYFKSFPSAKNIITQAMSNLLNLVDFLYFILMIFIISGITGLLILLLSVIGLANQVIDANDFVTIIIFIIILGAILKKSVNSLNKNNVYSFNEEQITKMVNEKIKYYNNLENEIYFLNQAHSPDD